MSSESSEYLQSIGRQMPLGNLPSHYSRFPFCMIDVNRQNEVRDDGQAVAVPNGLRELESLKELAKSANARIYIGFDKHRSLKED